MTFDITNIAALLCSIQTKNVLVFGDVMLDRFIDGAVTRISPEAPVPVLKQLGVHQMAGGAANVACNLAHLGVNVRLIGVCGNDDAAVSLKNEISRFPAIQSDLISIDNRPTTVKTRYRAGGQQILRVDYETTKDIDNKDSKTLLEVVKKAIDNADLLVISDYKKGTLPDALIRQIIACAKKSQKTIVVDPKRNDISAYSGADILTPNLKELREITSLSLKTIDSQGKAASALAHKHNFGGVLTTLSAKGMIMSKPDGTQFYDPANSREIFDVSGAGDTVVATIAAVLAVNGNLNDAVRLANHAAGVVISKSGTAVVNPGELLERFGASAVINDWESINEQCSIWRDSQQKIAFTNGCFDLLHPGHIFLLKQAAKHADKLIVGLNSDASVKRLKGNGRPLQSVEKRCAILTALPFVDAVAVFEQNTPIELISKFKPDVLVKGSDYNEQTVIGADTVKARGGKVIIISKLDGHATSKFVQDQ